MRKANKNSFVEMVRVVLNRQSFYLYHRHEFDLWTEEETCCQYEIHTRNGVIFTSSNYPEVKEYWDKLIAEAYAEFQKQTIYPMGLRAE